jgi:hypothetical protein
MRPSANALNGDGVLLVSNCGGTTAKPLNTTNLSLLGARASSFAGIGRADTLPCLIRSGHAESPPVPKFDKFRGFLDVE